MANYTPLKQTDGVIGFQLVTCLWLPSAQSPTWSQLEQLLSHWEASSACPGISSNSSHELDWLSPSMYQTLKRQPLLTNFLIFIFEPLAFLMGFVVVYLQTFLTRNLHARNVPF